MKSILIASAFLLTLSSCQRHYKLENKTRPAGYAKGERIALRFSLSHGGRPPDSINVWIFEKKTGYEYSDWAHKDSCGATCLYTCVWDGRKPDGGWPAGGRYLVYAVTDLEKPSFSDTVTIGLGD